jgi:hypothetical protein
MYLTTSNKIHSLAVLTILNVPLWLGEKSNAKSTAGSFLFGMWCYVVWWKCISLSEDPAVFIIRGDELTNPDDDSRKLVQNVYTSAWIHCITSEEEAIFIIVAPTTWDQLYLYLGNYDSVHRKMLRQVVLLGTNLILQSTEGKKKICVYACV